MLRPMTLTVLVSAFLGSTARADHWASIDVSITPDGIAIEIVRWDPAGCRVTPMVLPETAALVRHEVEERQADLHRSRSAFQQSGAAFELDPMAAGEIAIRIEIVVAWRGPVPSLDIPDRYPYEIAWDGPERAVLSWAGQVDPDSAPFSIGVGVPATEDRDPMTQKRDVVAAYYLDSADRFYRESKYQSAHDNLTMALDLAPSRELRVDAQARLAEVQNILGLPDCSDGHTTTCRVDRMRERLSRANYPSGSR